MVDNIVDTEPIASDKINAKLIEARQQLELAASRLELKSVNKLIESDGFNNDTSWQDIPGISSEYRTRPHTSPRGVARFQSHIADRSEGRWAPFYTTNQDLQIHRAQARNLATFTAIAVGAMERLADYTIGRNWTYTVVPRSTGDDIESNVPVELVAELQRVVDDTLETNEWFGDLDREIHNASREDGDVPLLIEPGPHGVCRIDLASPEQMTEPANPHRIESWIDSPESQWHFGVHALPVGHNRFDYARPAGYHIIFDDGGSQWDYYPSHPSPYFDNGEGRFCHHIKRNVGRSAARGISDYWSVIQDLEGEHKLARNTRSGAAVQAAIGYIVEHAAGVSKSSIESNVAANAVWMNDLVTQTGTQTRNVLQARPGERIDLGKGEIYHAGPMGNLRSPIFIEVASFILRRIGVRWSMPEYMISGDASNSNFASTLVSESPFVKARESDQDYFANRFRSMLFKCLRVAWIHGRFDTWVNDWGQIRRLIDISIDTPSPASRNRLEQAQVNQIEFAHGIIDERQWATDAGRDPDEVQPPRSTTEQPILSGNESALAQLGAAIESVGGLGQAREILDGIYSNGD